jgi:hypothetical protein
VASLDTTGSLDAGSRAGRPRTTSRHEVQRVALAMFAERGFEQTTLDHIAHPETDLLRELDHAYRLLAAGFDERALCDVSRAR